MTKQTFTLTVGTDTDLTIQAENSGRTWNGFAVPILTAEQAEIVGRAIGEPIAAGHCEGLTWEMAPCTDCGMPHTTEHACEPIGWTYGEA